MERRTKKVIYVKHSYSHHSQDRFTFAIGEIYDSYPLKGSDLHWLYKGDDKIGMVLSYQVADFVINCKLNKALYPDYYEYGEYLVSKENK